LASILFGLGFMNLSLGWCGRAVPEWIPQVEPGWPPVFVTSFYSRSIHFWSAVGTSTGHQQDMVFCCHCLCKQGCRSCFRVHCSCPSFSPRAKVRWPDLLGAQPSLRFGFLLRTAKARGLLFRLVTTSVMRLDFLFVSTSGDSRV
jgi:hypothetical protein